MSATAVASYRNLVGGEQLDRCSRAERAMFKLG